MLETNVALPSKPRVIKEEEFSGIFEIDGLYPGYGHTLGNSLRSEERRVGKECRL